MINELFEDYKLSYGKSDSYGMMDPDDMMMHGGSMNIAEHMAMRNYTTGSKANKKMFY
jgi:hypothetical protein